MIPFLDPLRESIWVRITLMGFGCGCLAVALWIMVVEVLHQGVAFAIPLAGSITICVAVLIGKSIANYAIQATDFLARSILLVTENNSYIAAPNADSLKVGHDFLASLATKVYNLVGSSLAVATTVAKTDGSVDLYRSMINNIPLPVIILDHNQSISFINNAGLEYIELSQESVISKPFYDAINLSFSSSTMEEWLKDKTTNCVVDDEVWERVRLDLPDNRRKQFDLAAHYSKNDTNGLEVTLVIFDKTAAYERDERDFTFISLAAHELRTPLTIMRGYIEVFEDELGKVLNNEQTAFMHNMGASAQQLTSFVSNILNVSRVDENALYLRLKEESWPEVLKLACQDMELRAKVHNKSLTYEIADNLPTVAIDRVSIYEVIANLIDNAIKYTHTDEKILVKTYEKDGMIETIVSDKGVGISDALVGHVFDKFYRAHNSKNSVGGTGLGLYLCRAIINAHGGNIWVKSKEGEGSTFGFTVPIFANVADQIKNKDNGDIVRGAHGWIKNHSFYRE